LYVDKTVTQPPTAQCRPVGGRCSACLAATGAPYCTVPLFDPFIAIPFLLGRGPRLRMIRWAEGRVREQHVGRAWRTVRRR